MTTLERMKQKHDDYLQKRNQEIERLNAISQKKADALKPVRDVYNDLRAVECISFPTYRGETLTGYYGESKYSTIDHKLKDDVFSFHVDLGSCSSDEDYVSYGIDVSTEIPEGQDNVIIKISARDHRLPKDFVKDRVFDNAEEAVEFFLELGARLFNNWDYEIMEHEIQIV